MTKLSGFYNQEDFFYLHDELKNISNFYGKSPIPNLACFYGKTFNFYIDICYGISSELNTQESCAKIFSLLKKNKDKKFFYFKCSYSKKLNRNLKSLVEENGGQLIPFFHWIRDSEKFNILNSIKEEDSPEKKYDIGIFYPQKTQKLAKPSQFNSLINHDDHFKYNIFGQSSNTGYLLNNRSFNIFDRIKKCNTSILELNIKDYKDYIYKSKLCKLVVLNSSQQDHCHEIWEQTFLGNAVVLNKSCFDYSETYSEHIPSLDFYDKTLPQKITDILVNHKNIGISCKSYNKKYLNPNFLFNFIKNKILY